ncbi:hypothetical protein BD309DRAFT_877914 [Dichomitus squalens]|uniref:Uncharacterized protein n=1 Tax=Dichomitus squalens TaxID=114155 RepID=A0A4V2K672_9APHY|nr:hypothetical protein BD309DRAFT_877914 [Dichomitus squalens]TBU51163.1 hypothetical protein BD310DRAFT_835102 [Dichomitus squalens]
MAGADEPQNTLLLEPNARAAFIRYKWCLLPTDIANCYEIQMHKSNYLGATQAQDRVTFKDYSLEAPAMDSADAERAASYLESSQHRGVKRRREQAGVDLPNPKLLRVHAALTILLRSSGAADIFDTMIRWRSNEHHQSVPEASGRAFWESVVIYEGPEICLSAELQNAAEAIGRLSTSTDSE